MWIQCLLFTHCQDSVIHSLQFETVFRTVNCYLQITEIKKSVFGHFKFVSTYMPYLLQSSHSLSLFSIICLIVHDFSWLSHLLPTVWDISQDCSLINKEFGIFIFSYLKILHFVIDQIFHYISLGSSKSTHCNSFPSSEIYFLKVSTIFIHKKWKNPEISLWKLSIFPVLKQKQKLPKILWYLI